MESKKRPHADDGEHSRAKKRAVSDDHASPSHPNGNATPHGDEPKEGDNIELFRKEAIYRRMKYYSREAERSQARVAELERRFSTCQAGLAALEACWTQLIGTIRSLVKPEDLPSLPTESEGELFSGVYDLALHLSSDAPPEYVDTVRTKMQSTSDIVRAIVNLSTQSQSSPSEEQLMKRCHEAETERSALRSELSLLRTQLQDTQSQKDRLHDQLVAAEKRTDRLQSKSLNPNPSSTNTTEEPAESASVEPVSSPAPQAAVNGTHSMDSDEWRDLANLRETKIEELMRENTDLQNQLQAAQLQLKAPPDDLITESFQYKLLQERASRLEHTAQEAQSEAAKLKEQLDSQTASRSEFEIGMKFVNEAIVAELKQLVSKRDFEIGRLREQRDQHQAEINERKAKEQIRSASALEFRALAEARAERIAVFELENKRLKTRLAANAGDEDLVKFLWENTSEDTTFIDDLRRRLSAAEDRVAALEKTLSGRGDVAKSEAEVRRQLAQVQKELDKYRAVYGNASSLPPDVAQLSEQLQRKQQELDKVQLQDKEREQTESALYSELDKLSAAWEALDKQVKKKVYDLASLEDRLIKINTEKAKSDNRFYQCMRDKDSLDTERKKLSLNVEKAAKVIEKLQETEKNLTTRLGLLEKELVLHKKIAEEQKERGNKLETDLDDWRIRAQGERKSADELRAAFAEHTQAIERKRTELRKLEESLLKTRKDAEKHAAKLKSTSESSGASTKEVELQKELNKCMSLLKCSTCQMNMRNTVITKCMHSFCKSCVDARIATRQRKCPACNLPFSQGEVQQLYFQ
ncbi:BRE1-domain-containing protein [Earliella scabrosa]|nr:BRE1-domain-containing protein [Earliella scabrosa]